MRQASQATVDAEVYDSTRVLLAMGGSPSWGPVTRFYDASGRRRCANHTMRQIPRPMLRYRHRAWTGDRRAARPRSCLRGADDILSHLLSDAAASFTSAVSGRNLS